MNLYATLQRQLQSPEVMHRLQTLYGTREGMLVAQRARYTKVLKRHEDMIGSMEGPIYMISAPGRTEIAGNHTDHNRGKVLAAAVNLDTLAAVSPRSDSIVNIHSEGYPALSISIAPEELAPRKEEEGTTAALVRGVAHGMHREGLAIGGFDAVVTSDVRSGSGLSSSAAFEVLVCAIFDRLYAGNRLDAKKRAIISQYAENVYFGKPSGLMDQMASSVGGLCYIDFQDPDPQVVAISYDFAKMGYQLVVVNTGGSHDDLTPAYAAIPQEMKAVAQCLGQPDLRSVLPEQFMRKLPKIREELKGRNADRAILRAAHYFAENNRVSQLVQTLQQNDLPEFLRLIIESGRSSFEYLQNIFATADRQELALALMLSQRRLEGKGAWRVHGGGFAGTTLNFVPCDMLDTFVKDMETVFGQHSCNVLSIRPEGPACITLE
ncbi:MAG: galactokinase [Clostridia bacterium]|nr:galactokinase [Clostridia bacterium]